MRKSRFLSLCLCLALLSVGVLAKDFSAGGSSLGDAAMRNGFPNVFRPVGRIIKRLFGKKTRIIYEYNPNVADLILSRNLVAVSCASSENSYSGKGEIGIYTMASDPENGALIYHYTVSGGRIIGNGDKVVWDLSGEKPGSYTITAGVDDGCGVCGNTKTKSAMVIERADCK